MTEESYPSPSARRSLVPKMFVTGVIVLVLMLPITWIRDLIAEREIRHDQVKAEISSTWGGAQRLHGPVLSVPYLQHWKNAKGEEQTYTYCAYFLPDDLRIEGTVQPEIRWRGIFEAILYGVKLRFRGRFDRPDLGAWKIAEGDVLWDDATLSIGISDLRSVAKEPALRWGDQDLHFRPGPGNVDGLYTSGMQVPIPGLRDAAAAAHEFAFEIALSGSDELTFVPAGKETEVALSSPWRDPSFVGAFLPAERKLDADGFRATWKVSYFGRSFPQHWRASDAAASTLAKQTPSAAFGVRLLDPIDFYRMSDRSVKYAMLFVVLTFVAFALFEILNRLRLHPVQYLLVGLALCLFFLILLSLSEQIGFAAAYAVGTVATIALIGGYTSAVLASGRRAAVMSALVGGLYGYLYVLLELEDYALLLGTAGLFAILASVMYLTRRLDWYAVELGPAAAER